MATIQSIKLANEENIRSKTAPGSITKNADADMRDVVANEIRDRGLITVADTTSLVSQTKDNARRVFVESVGLFEALESAEEVDNVNSFDSADEGWIWKKSIDITAGMSKVQMTYEEDSTYVLKDGQWIDKILIKPAGNSTIKIGTTEDGDEIMLENNLEADKWYPISMDLVADGADITIYFSGITSATNVRIYTRTI